MPIVKGVFLGIWLSSFSTIAYLYFSIYRKLPPSTAVGITVFQSYTIYNPFWWMGLIVSFAIGLFITRRWTGSPALWITLAVTELFPLALFGALLMLVIRVRQMSGK